MIMVNDEVWKKARVRAIEEGVTVSDWVLSAITVKLSGLTKITPKERKKPVKKNESKGPVGK